MGNCICSSFAKESLTEWGGEEWGSVLSEPEPAPEKYFRREKTEVKVKITKKQLEELLSKVGGGGGGGGGKSLNQVLQQLMSMNPHTTSSWRPSLHSILESKEY